MVQKRNVLPHSCTTGHPSCSHPGFSAGQHYCFSTWWNLLPFIPVSNTSFGLQQDFVSSQTKFHGAEQTWKTVSTWQPIVQYCCSFLWFSVLFKTSLVAQHTIKNPKSKFVDQPSKTTKFDPFNSSLPVELQFNVLAKTWGATWNCGMGISWNTTFLCRRGRLELSSVWFSRCKILSGFSGEEFDLISSSICVLSWSVTKYELCSEHPPCSDTQMHFSPINLCSIGWKVFLNSQTNNFMPLAFFQASVQNQEVCHFLTEPCTVDLFSWDLRWSTSAILAPVNLFFLVKHTTSGLANKTVQVVLLFLALCRTSVLN